MVGLCRSLIEEQKWTDALPIAKKIIEILPEDASENSGRMLLTSIYHRLEKTDDEREALVAIEQRSSDCLESLVRLVEIDLEKANQKAVLAWCDRILEIDPTQSSVHEYRATAAESLKRPAKAVESLYAMIALEPIDAASVHFRLARSLLDIEKKEQAKRHLLMALEESPRYRDALELLLEITEND